MHYLSIRGVDRALSDCPRLSSFCAALPHDASRLRHACVMWVHDRSSGAMVMVSWPVSGRKIRRIRDLRRRLGFAADQLFQVSSHLNVSGRFSTS